LISHSGCSGDIGAAEDIVQDAFTRLMAARPGEIQDERGWLIVVTSRLCLDQIKSARSRRERAHDASQIEFAAPPQKGLADPADRVTFDDGVRLALLVVLQQLSPAERVVFVLHDIFQMPFDTVAETVGRSAPACRQLASRARQKIAASPGSARFDIASVEHRLVTDKFIAACSNGDLRSLLGVLAPDAWGDVDLGPGVTEFSGVFKGAKRVARNLLRFWGQGATLVSPGRRPARGARLHRPPTRRPAGVHHARRAHPGDPRHRRPPQAGLPQLAAHRTGLEEPLRAGLTSLAGVTIRGHISSLLVPPLVPPQPRRPREGAAR
jgi:RNA polymerase sigma-70 factor, ECF subfamily